MNGSRNLLALVGVGSSVIALTQCSPVGVDYELPYVKTPDTWSASLASEAHSKTPRTQSWMSVFNDSRLNQLLRRAKSHNKDLKIAAQTVSISGYETEISRSKYKPTLSQTYQAARGRGSENLTGISQSVSNTFSEGLIPSWEIDLFGQLRRTVEFAERSETATAEAYRDLMVSVYAEVTNLYIDYRTIQARTRVNRDQVSSLKETVQIAKDKLEAGLTSKLDLLQAQTELKNATSVTPQLKAQLVQTQNALAVLCGCYAKDLDSLLSSPRSIPSPNRLKSLPLPAQLVRSRPDIRKAERELAAQTARIGIAEAELYPKLKLTGDFSLESKKRSNILDSASFSYSFGPQFEWNLFRGGSLRKAIREEEAATEQALLFYEKSVLNAVAEVESSMSGISLERDRYGQLRQALSHSKEALDLVKENYKEGLTDFERVIDSERAQFETEDRVVLSKGEIAKFYVSLYKSLGGGVSYEPIQVDQPRTLAKRYAKKINATADQKDEKNK